MLVCRRTPLIDVSSLIWGLGSKEYNRAALSLVGWGLWGAKWSPTMLSEVSPLSMGCNCNIPSSAHSLLPPLALGLGVSDPCWVSWSLTLCTHRNPWPRAHTMSSQKAHSPQEPALNIPAPSAALNSDLTFLVQGDYCLWGPTYLHHNRKSIPRKNSRAIVGFTLCVFLISRISLAIQCLKTIILCIWTIL